jgi:alkylation response protein AidB-like acyl-CoA dehydrogenase
MTTFPLPRDLYQEEHLAFGKAFEQFMTEEVAPHHAEWEARGYVDPELWKKAGVRGFLAMDVGTQYGGPGLNDFRYHAILIEIQARMMLSGPMFSLGTDIVIPYISRFGNDEQKQRWLPKLVSGEWISCIGMSEPQTGSDLASIEMTAEDRGDHYCVNGTKFWISNGAISSLIVLVVKTDPTQRHRGISLLVAEREQQPYETVQILQKMGYLARDVAELRFDNVLVPKSNLLGEAGQGFAYMMQQLPQERLTIAIGNVATAERVLDYTVEWCQERTAFGQPIGSFQNTRFKLAELATEIRIARVFVDHCVRLHMDGTLTPEEASMAKWWCSELLMKVNTTCLQFFGGRGYLIENPVAKAYRDTRVEPIYGGTNEIMKEIIGKGLGL